MPRISIVTPCYNGPGYVGRTIESVRAQAKTWWEQVIVDDGCVEDLSQTLAPYLAIEPRLRLIRQANGGLCNARNNGFTAASRDSQYLLFLDDDDLLEETMLEVMVSYLDLHPEACMAFCERTFIDEQGAVIKDFSPRMSRYVPADSGLRELDDGDAQTPFLALFAYCRIVPSISVIRRSAFELAGGWDEALGPQGEDQDLWLRLALLGEIHYVPQTLVRRRVHARSLSLSTSSSVRSQAYRRLWQKWSEPSWLNGENGGLIREAWRFRSTRVAPHLCEVWAKERLRDGDVIGAARFYLRALRRRVRPRGPAAPPSAGELPTPVGGALLR